MKWASSHLEGSLASWLLKTGEGLTQPVLRCLSKPSWDEGLLLRGSRGQGCVEASDWGVDVTLAFSSPPASVFAQYCSPGALLVPPTNSGPGILVARSNLPFAFSDIPTSQLPLGASHVWGYFNKFLENRIKRQHFWVQDIKQIQIYDEYSKSYGKKMYKNYVQCIMLKKVDSNFFTPK